MVGVYYSTSLTKRHMYCLFKNLRKTNIMKRKHFLTALTGVIMLALVPFACSRAGEDNNGDGDGDVNYNGQIIIKVNPDGEIGFDAVADKILINWGDGTVEKFTMEDGENRTFSHSYAGAGVRTVTVNMEEAIQFSIEGYHCEELTAPCPTLGGLSCSGNQLTSLDVSGCPALIWLWCSGNQLTSLDVSGCPALGWLWCYDNQLTSLDVSGCPALTEVSCYDNRLTSLNVSGCAALTEVRCDDNQLASLDVSGCTALDYLSCSGNQLTSLNVSGFAALFSLWCYNNQLTSLDVSGCPALSSLWCLRNQLSAGALNTLFEALPARSSDDGANIYIADNPGTDACNRSIASNKGWQISTTNPFIFP
jgi:Leucine-rich repeat (LRR) protein